MYESLKQNFPKLSFNKSENQDGEDMDDEFSEFCQRNADVLSASILENMSILSTLVLDIIMGSDTNPRMHGWWVVKSKHLSTHGQW
jgi:hypothetical protein